MATQRGDRRGAEIVHELFGANLQEQGSGFYVPLELLAIVRGTHQAARHEVLSRDAKPIQYLVASHDLARRIATGGAIPADRLELAIQGPSTRDTLQALFSSLVVTIPGRRRAPKWSTAHLYPFVGELVHYDAVDRRTKGPSIERYLFRDGGGLAHKILRTDPDEPRRIRVRDGLLDLVTDSGSALGRVAAALQAHDEATRSEPFTDTSEAEADPRDDCSEWPEILRGGVDRIVRRPATPSAKRVEQLMHWIPYCIARHQLRLAMLELDLPNEVLPIDATSEANPLRSSSHTVLERSRWAISAALERVANRLRDATPEQDHASWRRYTEPDASFTASPRAFYTKSLAAVGALNAPSGRRHFAFKAPMLEALVAASIEPDQEMEFQTFCDLLLDTYHIVIDQRSAQTTGLTTDIDAGVFNTNSIAFRSQLAATGLVTHFSDATTLVHGEAR